MRIAVIGAGIGGLAVAAGLQRAGAEVTVYERAPEIRAVGAGLSLFGNGFAALDALGLGDQVRALGGTGLTLRAGQRKPSGQWLSRTPSEAVAELAVVHRADLHRILLAALTPGTVQTGVEVGSVSEGGTGLTLTSHPEHLERFDLIIAADGIRSRVRAGWPTDPGIRYAGYAAWRGVTSAPVDLLGAAGETWGRGRRFGIAPLQDGRVYWFAVASMPAGTVVEDEYAAVTALFDGWHAPIAELIAATDPAAVFRLEINELAGPLPSFRNGRSVLLGDAAHAMTPDLGQGGNQALEDAATLVALIGSAAGAPAGPGLDRALDEYDSLRRPRTQLLARRARLVGRVAQTQGRLRAWLRDTAVRLLPDAVLGRQMLAVRRGSRLLSARPAASVRGPSPTPDGGLGGCPPPVRRRTIMSMTTEFAWPVAAEPPRPARPPHTGLRSPRSYAELVYAVVDLAPAIAFFVLIVTLLSVGIGLAIIYIGVAILALGLLAARFGGLVQRALALALLDLPTAAPDWAAPHRPGPISALAAVLRDPANWRAVAYFVIKIVLAPVTFGVAVGMYAYGLGAISYALWRPYLPEVVASDGTLHRGEQWWPDFFIDGWLSMTMLALLGLGVLWCAPRVVGFLTTIDRVLIGTLLSART